MCSNGLLEYFASGEPWVIERKGAEERARPAYLFNGKELDELTNLYYFGARY